MRDVALQSTFDSDGDNSAQAGPTTAKRLHGIHVYNPNTAAAFVQLFDLAAASVTVGTTTPKLVFFVPAQGAYDASWERGINFDTAITYACTTTATGNGDPTTGLTVTLIHG